MELHDGSELIKSEHGDWVAPPHGSLRHCLPNEKECISSYEDLVEAVARLAGLNPHLMLYFRGQEKIYCRDDGGPQLYPTLWREYPGHTFTDAPLSERILTLKRQTRRIYQAYSSYEHCERRVLAFMEESPIAQWALLQHYGVCDTPLLDVTSSLRVASSFALLKPDGSYRSVGYVYVLGLPHQSETILTSHDRGIVNVSLFGITPPTAKRPLRQKGYLAGSSDWWRLYSDWPNEYPPGHRVDLSCRLVAAYKIENRNGFRGAVAAPGDDTADGGVASCDDAADSVSADGGEALDEVEAVIGGHRAAGELMGREELMPSHDPFLDYLMEAGFEQP